MILPKTALFLFSLTLASAARAAFPLLDSFMLRRAIIASAVFPALVNPVQAVSGGGKEFAQKDIRGQDFSSQKFQGQDFTQCDGAGTNFQVFSLLWYDAKLLLFVEVESSRYSLLPSELERC